LGEAPLWSISGKMNGKTLWEYGQRREEGDEQRL
jgi:hypothetical protein